MKLLETEYQKKAFAITTSVFVLLFLLFIFYKITSEEREPVFIGGGIAINFGNSDVGKGEFHPKKLVETKSIQQKSPVSKAVEKKVVTQTKVETPVVKSSEKINDKKSVTNTPPPKKPTPSKSTTDALSNIINSSNSSGDNSGYGDDGQPGSKGKITGSMYANSFYGDGSGNGSGKGSGSGTSWGLNGRTLSSSRKIIPDCNEEGTVVVQIRVNRSGEVISAQQAKGTTNSSSCLTNAAIATAKTFRWRSDDKAPQEQVGFIVVNFSLK